MPRGVKRTRFAAGVAGTAPGARVGRPPPAGGRHEVAVWGSEGGLGRRAEYHGSVPKVAGCKSNYMFAAVLPHMMHMGATLALVQRRLEPTQARVRTITADER